ncbi:FAS1-like dehydratase domain-containing protein [Streptomyces sp. 4N509B]|uniref:FAS1-like dehydratase domain-containing protein n=1 Tax=Streptomyces sp. 4N509B TaxID=3457413 RepID=UPI003FD2103A
MALDQSFVGRSYSHDGPPYEVGREKIREFAEAIGDDNPAYSDPEAARKLGHPDVIAPPTFVFAISHRAVERQVIADPQLGLDYSRVVHGDQKFTYSRPVRAGDRLLVTSTIESIRTMRGNDILEIRGEVHDASGEHVVTAVSKLVARGPEEDEGGGSAA